MSKFPFNKMIWKFCTKCQNHLLRVKTETVLPCTDRFGCVLLIHLLTMAAERNSNTNLAIFSDMDSEFENFEGFDARDTRPYAEIASKAPLYHSTPQPKAKRVCRATINTCDSSNSDESSNISPVEDVRPGNASSSSSVEGEIAPLIFKVNFCKSMLPQASNNKESDTSSSSVEGEIYIVEEETVGKQPPLHVSQDGFARLGDTTISATSVFEQTIEDETPKTATRRRG